MEEAPTIRHVVIGRPILMIAEAIPLFKLQQNTSFEELNIREQLEQRS